MTSRVQQTISLETSVQSVKFVHGKRLEGLRELGIDNIRDLFEYYPFRYDDFSRVINIIDLPLGEKNAAMGIITEAKGRKTAKGGFLYEIFITDNTGVLKAVWFNQKWLADTLTVGKQVLLLGKVEHFNGYMNMSSPLYSLVSTERQSARGTDSDQELRRIESGVNPVGISPVYRANNKVSSNWIKRIILEARKLVSEPLDPLPPKLRIKRRLVSRQIAWHDIHSPDTDEAMLFAKNRLAYEQVFWIQLRLAFLDITSQKSAALFQHEVDDGTVQLIREQLPFSLTDSQQDALADIFKDMQAPHRMNRLLLGDVGSGKTVVALHALAIAAMNGWQAAMMAPTEILAQQYVAMTGPVLDALGITYTLLTSALSAGTRQKELSRISSGETQVVFGTHALIEPDVAFKDLSLIVVDEQQRFGVAHRDSLKAKSPGADFLSMTATPIPRSLALVLYGSVRVSYLKNRPQKAKTNTISIDSSVSYKAYEAIREALQRGEQAYIVCPLISAPAPPDDEQIQYLDDLEGFSDEISIAAAEAELEHLRTKVFPERRIELLTSRVKSQEKQNIMTDFKAGDIDIIVSTTVIEVGVDAPNATVMVILDADRFGLAQLHQLRGRVGRGTGDAQVFLVSNNPGESARRRLKALERYSDGLKLAEADLAERQEGDISGTRQHGVASLSFINVIRDRDLIEAAHKDAFSILAQDPDLSLPEHQLLGYELNLMETSGAN